MSEKIKENTMKTLNASCKLLLPLLIVALFISWNPSESGAKPECSEWSEIVCQQLGVTGIACGKAGVNLTAHGLITDQTPLKGLGFKFGEGPYRMSATRIDTGRYLVEIQSMGRENDNYKQEIALKTSADTVYPVRLAPAPAGKYTWNSAIQFDLEQQLGVRPVSQLKEKPRDFVDVRIADPVKMAKAGFPGFKMNEGNLQLLYMGNNQWELSPIGGLLVYENAAWSTNSSAAAPKPSPSPSTVIAGQTKTNQATASGARNGSRSRPAAAHLPSSDLLFVNSNFEKGDLTNWTATGDAFKYQPTKGDNPTVRGRNQPSKHQGKYWIGTFEKYNGKSELSPGQTQGDRPTGTLTSVSFVVSRERIVFLIGGGKHPDKEYAALVVDGREVLKTTGKRKETMHKVVWDVRKFAGKQAQIVIKDLHHSGWGHINADYFHFQGAAFEPPPVTNVVSSELTVKGYGKYFNNAEIIIDGHFPKEGSLWKGRDCVWWRGKTPYFLVDLGNTSQVCDIIMQVDNNDNYMIDYSLDGTEYFPLLIIKKGYGKIGHGMDTMTTRNGHPDYISQLDFQPVSARFLKIYAAGGDNNYAISELKVITERR